MDSIQTQIDKLKKELDELKAWKEARTRQQISFPLDTTSIDILNKHFLRVYGKILSYTNTSGREFWSLLTKQDTELGELSVFIPVIFTVNPTTNILTTSVPLANAGELVYMKTTGTLPAPLNNTSPYYIMSPSGNTCKLSSTPGPTYTEVDITNNGTGIHYISLS